MDTAGICFLICALLLPLINKHQVPRELKRLIKSAFPPTQGANEALVSAVYQALEFFQPDDEEAHWGNIAVVEPNAVSAGRGLMNALRTAAESVALAQLSNISNECAQDFAQEIMKERERVNKLRFSSSSRADDADTAWSKLSPQARFGKVWGRDVHLTRSNPLEPWERR